MEIYNIKIYYNDYVDSVCVANRWILRPSSQATNNKYREGDMIMREFIKLLDEGYEVSIHTEPNTGCYIFDFKKGKEKIKLIKLSGAFDFIEVGLIFDNLAKHVKDKMRNK